MYVPVAGSILISHQSHAVIGGMGHDGNSIFAEVTRPSTARAQSKKYLVNTIYIPIVVCTTESHRMALPVLASEMTSDMSF